MYFIYNLIVNFIFIFSPVILLFRLLNGKEDIKRFQEKFCIYKEKNLSECIWLHAASVGELMSIIPVLKELEKSKKVKKIILTTSTTSSVKIFKKQFFKKTTHKYFPLDTNFLNNKFLSFWKPKLAIFVESEIWPNMFRNLNKRKIPLVILNARVTEKTFNKWKIFDKFSKKVFKKITLALPQNDETKNFLSKLGVKKINIAGNLKYYGNKNTKFQKNLIFEKKFKKFKIWCASSTHHNEEILISKIHKNLKKHEKKILTIIIPRHINRSEEIIGKIRKMNLNVVSHSSNKKIKQNTDIYLVDTYGETSKFFNLSKITFVGGSIVNHGGQNPLEPARFGNHIINGPHIKNFREIYAFLIKNKISQTKNNLKTMERVILNKLNKNISTQKTDKIFKIGNKILYKNMFYLKKYIK